MEKNKIKEKIIKRKSEQGAITLFVLLACLFFVFTLAGVYISNLNRLKVQEEDIKQIQENYARELNRINEVHDQIKREIDVKITANP